MPTLVADEREPDGIVHRLRGMGIEVERIFLEAGDYVFEAHGKLFGIERKTATNLLQSMGDRQLAEQVRGLLRYDVPILLIVGSLRKEPDGKLAVESVTGWFRTGWEYSAVSALLLELKLSGIVVEEHPGLDSAEAVARVFRFCQDSHEFLRLRRKQTFVSLTPAYTRAMEALMALPGVGAEAASALMSHFGSLREVMNAPVEELAQVKVSGRKWGTSRASKFRAEVDRKW